MVPKMAMVSLFRGKGFILCFTRVLAAKPKSLVSAANADLAFISLGFANWNDAPENDEVLASQCRKCSVQAVVILPQTTQDPGDLLSTELVGQRVANRQYLGLVTDYALFSETRFRIPWRWK